MPKNYIKAVKIPLIISLISFFLFIIVYYFSSQCQLGRLMERISGNHCLDNPGDSFPCICADDIIIDLLLLYTAIISTIVVIIKIIILKFKKKTKSE